MGPSALPAAATLLHEHPHALRLDDPSGRTAVVRVHTLDLACCAMEAAAALALVEASAGEHREAAPDVPPTEGTATEGTATEGTATDVLVVAGTVTDRIADDVVRAYADLAARTPRCRVVSYGACANTGGPYWDSYSVTKGVDQLIPVDAYVAGCPPRPQALLDALVEVART